MSRLGSYVCVQPFLVKIAALECQSDLGMLRIIRSQSHASKTSAAKWSSADEGKFREGSQPNMQPPRVSSSWVIQLLHEETTSPQATCETRIIFRNLGDHQPLKSLELDLKQRFDQYDFVQTYL